LALDGCASDADGIRRLLAVQVDQEERARHVQRSWRNRNL
jgi:hypothetical protein